MTMKPDDKKLISIEQAINLLPRKQEIHTFRQVHGILIGCDWPRNKVTIKMIDHRNEIELAGDNARERSHGLVVTDESGPLFIETDKNSLDQFDPKN